MHIGDDGLARLEAVDPGQRVIDTKMAGMAGIAQPVDDPEIEILKIRPALGRDVADIGCVGGRADAIPERRDVAVLQKEGGNLDGTTLPFDNLALAGFDRMLREDRRIFAARRRYEAI